MLRKTMMTAGLVLAMTAPGFAAEWVVIKSSDACYVTDEKGPGEDQVSEAYATEAEATAAMKKIAQCDKVNIDLDPDEDDETGGGNSR